jgi:putative Holliday junction resolvase
LGIAISDPTRTIASPLTVINHISRLIDAGAIANLARENKVGLIVIGTSLDEEGASTPQSRRAERLAAAIKSQCDLPIETWDESFSTQDARNARIEMRTNRSKRYGHLDQIAAVVILQSYLNSQQDV